MGHQHRERGRIEAHMVKDIPHGSGSGLVIGYQGKEDNIASWNVELRSQLSPQDITHPVQPDPYRSK